MRIESVRRYVYIQTAVFYFIKADEVTLFIFMNILRLVHSYAFHKKNY